MTVVLTGQEVAGAFMLRNDNQETLSSDRKTEAPTALLASAKSLRGRAEAMLAKELAESDATAIRTELAALAPAIEARDWSELQRRLDTLSDLLFYLED